MNPVVDNILKRKSIRSYTDQSVEKEKLDVLIQAARNAPTGRNNQTFQFTVVQKGEIHNRLIKAISQRRGNDSYSFYGVPTIIITSDEKEDENGAYNCACAFQNMALAAASIDLGSVWINQIQEFCDEPEVRSILTEIGVPESHKVHATLAVGYAKEDLPAKERTSAVKYCQ